METTATLRGVRLSAQKGRLVADLVRGMPVGRALDVLAFSPKKGARILRKVLESAIANAEHNDGADIDELKVTTIYVDKAETLKRMSARAKGRGNTIGKQSCHIHVAVDDGKAKQGIPWDRRHNRPASASRSPVPGRRAGSPPAETSPACWPRTCRCATT